MATAVEETLSLASALVRLGRERGVAVERLRAEQLLSDAQTAWPGDPDDRWDKWLREAADSVSLRCRVADLTTDAAIGIAASGGLLVGGSRGGGQVAVLVGAKGADALVAQGELEATRRVSRATLATEIAGSGDAEAPSRWLIVDHPQLSESHDAPGLAHKPIRRYYKLLRPEWSDIWIILVFAFFAGVLSLATPIAVEALVDTVAFGQLLQPVVILAAVLFGFLAFAGIMQGLQTYVVEIIQRRLFARVSADLAYRLPRVERGGLAGAHAPELVNRFLDVATLQKVSATLLTDGLGIVLATIVGMTVLAFYSPWLLGFDILLLILVVGGLTVLGRGAIPAAIKESKIKYGLTAWFEDIVRCQNGFKSSGGAAFANDRASSLTTEYLGYRQKHFAVFFRQMIFVLGLQAVAGTILLGAGGWLVIQGDMTLGQLVAAELIVATILGSLAKLGKHLESFYDVVAAVDKLGVLFDLPVERMDGVLTLPPGEGARLRLTGVRHASGALAQGIDAEVDAGERVAVLGPAGSGKSTLLRILYGLDRPSGGHVEIEHSDPRDVRPDVLREHVALVGEPEIFTGTIAENIHVHRQGVTANEVRATLFAVGLLDPVLRLPAGIETPLNASGGPLSLAQQRLLMLARAIVTKPRLVLIDGLLDALPDDSLRLITEMLNEPKPDWTVVVATGREKVADAMQRTIRLGVDDPSDEAETGEAP